MCIRDRDSGFTQVNETLDNTSDGINEEIKNAEESSVLFSGNKDNKDNEKIKHIKTHRRRVKKNRVIKKIKKTKEIGKIYKKKLLKTREEVEMMKNGLIDVFNLPITDQSKFMKYKDCRRTLKAIIEGSHNTPAEENFSKSIRKWKLPKFERTLNKTVCHKLKRSLKHWSTPELEMQNKKSIMTLMREVQLTSLINQQHNIVSDVGMETNEHMVLEELWYEIEDTYFTRTEIVLHTKVIRTTSAEEMTDHG